MNQVNERKRVLVTALGTMNCTTIVKELRKLPYNFYIIGADINTPQSIFTSTEVDEYHQFPKATEDREAYFVFVKNFCIEHHVDVYFCVVDEEVETIALHREELNSLGITLCIPNTDAIVICHNKDKFAVWSEKNIPEYCIKRYCHFEDIGAEDFPLFIKPIEGRASIGCKKVENINELYEYRDHWNNYIVQKFTTGTIVAADVVRCRKTSLTQICQRQELLRNSNGCGIAVRIIKNDEIDRACVRIAELLDLDGIVNIEFFINDYSIKIIEVNPRIPAGVAYSCLAGLNLISLAFDIANGKSVMKYAPLQLGAYYAKRYETYEVVPAHQTDKVVLTTYSRIFLHKSLAWLNDPVMQKGMDIHNVITEEMQEKWYKSLPTRKDYRIWGILYEGIPIGACGFRNITSYQGELTCYIGDAAYRGKGIAPLMIKELEIKGKRLGFKRIVLKVLTTNKAAYSLYKKCSFNESKRDNKYIYMEKQIISN